MIKRLYYILKQRLYIYKQKQLSNQGKVYMFHEINNDSGVYSISKENFNTFIEYLINNKNIVDFETLTKNKNINNVVLTFDDVYESIYTEAFDILKSNNIPYYLFVCNEYLNKDKYLSDKQIRSMLDESNAILASHSYRHQLSRFLNNDEFINYLNQSKKELETKFNKVINCFAFPFGSLYACSNDNISEAAKIFDYVCMTYPLPYNESYRNIIPRININNGTFLREMK